MSENVQSRSSYLRFDEDGKVVYDPTTIIVEESKSAMDISDINNIDKKSNKSISPRRSASMS